MARTVLGLLSLWIVLYDAKHDVDGHQWWIATIIIGIAFATGIFDIYDRPMPDGLLGPMNMTNLSWLILAIGAPLALFFGGALGGHVTPVALGAIVLTVNLVLLSGIRERGLPGLIAVMAIVAMALLHYG